MTDTTMRNYPPSPFRAQPHKFTPQRFLARARQFRHEAAKMVDMHGPELNWPKYFLMTHAIELAIKAYLNFQEEINGPPPSSKGPDRHDLVGLYDFAVERGMRRNPVVTAGLPELSELHKIHYARYPKEDVRPVSLIAYYDDMVGHLFADVAAGFGPPWNEGF
jgi:hypothetical protein